MKKIKKIDFTLFLNNISTRFEIPLFNVNKRNLNWLFTLIHWSFGNTNQLSKKVREKEVTRKKCQISSLVIFIFK